MRPFRFLIVAFVAVIAITACASFKGEPSVHCGARPCTVAIQNDAMLDVVAAYADTTGRRGALGRIRAGSMGVFGVQRILSSRVRILVTTRDGEYYDAIVPMLRAGPAEVHFPSDFRLVAAKSVP